ncbi:Crp/Fnr family transcriptional regulator [Paenibacillus filicis]|uniref:Crp/Fnr family transcriptional regulator n=1 Tax=Paenibacillus gyeongsangnamensis TaxID=3388067 RepID=A0ABT4QIN2_9BACL|nr:Crp/Fnr family transcriptional regulator [Paenibacillus filicis]MCZ8516729.1 Crp/Fnr family transcriptional regulator [Paenibacillus filicis]
MAAQVMEMKQGCKAGSCGETTACGVAAFFTEAHMRMLEDIMYGKKSVKGSHVFREGDEADKLYFIRSGRVKLTKTTEEGRILNLSLLREGDMIGELGMTGGGIYDYSAEVIENAEFGVIQEKDLEILLYRFGEFAVAFTKWMAQQHRVTQLKFRDLLLFGKPGALASTLIRLCNSYGVVTKKGIRISVKLTNTELADFIGATRESVNRMLSDLKKDGIVDMDAGHLLITSLNELKSICQCPSYPACPREICRI